MEPPRCRGKLCGARESQLFFGCITTKMFSKIHLDIATTTEQHYIIRIAVILKKKKKKHPHFSSSSRLRVLHHTHCKLAQHNARISTNRMRLPTPAKRLAIQACTTHRQRSHMHVDPQIFGTDQARPFFQTCSLCQTIWTRGLPTRDSTSITGLVLDKSFP